jgi:hypothetical protein
MRRAINVVTAALLAVTFSTMVMAYAPTQTEKKTTTKAEKKSGTLAAHGTVAKFDEATRDLTLTTKEGNKDFTLQPNAKIMEGAKAVTTSELAGKHVKVTYSHVNGKNVASKVTVASTSTQASATKATAKK